MYYFDCKIWNNAKQKSAQICLLVNVVSLTALNNALKDEGMDDWVVIDWSPVEQPMRTRGVNAA